MVVTRRTPAAPPSRTPSSQAVHRVPAPRRKDLNGTSTTTGATDATYRRQQPKKKPNKKKRRGGLASLIHILIRALSLFFAIYTLSVCPSDVSLQSPTCRALSEYRRLVLEPYILPTINLALDNPSISPYVDRVRPYAHKALVLASASKTEVEVRAVPFWNERAVPTWIDRVYEPFVKPYYETHIVPQIHHIQTLASPYIETLRSHYTTTIEPRLNHLAALTIRAYQVSLPHILRALHASQTYAERARPYILAAFANASKLAARLAREAGVARAKFVDPHLRKIWARMKELSAGDGVGLVQPVAEGKDKVTKPDATASHVVHGGVVVEETPVVTQEESTPVVAVPDAAEQVVFNAPEPVIEATAESVVQEATETAASIVKDATAAVEPVVEDATAAVKSVVEEAIAAAETVVEEATAKAEPVMEEITATAESIVEEVTAAAEPVVEDATAAVKSVVEQATASTPSPASASADTTPSPTPLLSAPSKLSSIDLDAFYAELGLDTDDAPPPTPTPTPDPELTAEELARMEEERLRKIAAKRAEIQGRHTVWEEKLDALVRDNTKKLRRTLNALRKPAAQTLKSDATIKATIDSLVADAERLLAGAEAYFKNLRREEGRGGEGEKVGVWERVLGRVDERFTEKLREAERVVNGWYAEHTAREEAEVMALAKQVRDLADAAQADVGLDYVWLEDVSYRDWSRYHDLLRRAENFQADAESYQNGTTASPNPSSGSSGAQNQNQNPVLGVLEELENEVADVVLGFETRVRQLRRAGARAFGKKRVWEDEEDEDANAEDDKELDAEEQALLNDPDVVKILPVPEENEGVLKTDDAVLVGRGKKEVEEAFARAEAVEKAREEEGKKRAHVVAAEAVESAEAEVQHNEL